jgi:hypothetical protein
MEANGGECKFGGWGGIRTHGELSPTPVFKTGAFNRSATHPRVRAMIYRHGRGQGRANYRRNGGNDGKVSGLLA